MTNIFETILKTNGLEILAVAVKITNLDRTLDNSEPLTVFAPDNQAFTSLPKKTLQKLSQDIPLLTRILSAHIVDGNLRHQDLLRIYDRGDRNITQTAIDGTQLNIDLSDGIRIGKATILSVGIAVSNVIIYPIDRVLLPHEFTQPAENFYLTAPF